MPETAYTAPVPSSFHVPRAWPSFNSFCRLNHRSAIAASNSGSGSRTSNPICCAQKSASSTQSAEVVKVTDSPSRQTLIRLNDFDTSVSSFFTEPTRAVKTFLYIRQIHNRKASHTSCQRTRYITTEYTEILLGGNKWGPTSIPIPKSKQVTIQPKPTHQPANQHTDRPTEQQRTKTPDTTTPST